MNPNVSVVIYTLEIPLTYQHTLGYLIKLRWIKSHALPDAQLRWQAIG